MWPCQSEDGKINVWRQFYIKFTAVIYIYKKVTSKDLWSPENAHQ